MLFVHTRVTCREFGSQSGNARGRSTTFKICVPMGGLKVTGNSNLGKGNSGLGRFPGRQTDREWGHG